MKTPLSQTKTAWAFILAVCVLAITAGQVKASIAYGTINNFDTVNDTGTPCHGFEIELDDVQSSTITYTYDYNHYGVPKITQDNTDPLHPKVFVTYQAVYASGSWSAFTAVPSAPIAPTMGHQFTNPSVNFGGEHFGVGYTGSPTAVKYNWLIDNGSGVLVHGGAVNVSTPVFAYSPPVAAAPGVPAVPAVVQAVIPAPVVPLPPAKEFGQATWVREIRTTTHNNNPVKIEDLVSKDAAYPNAKNWTNNEPDEVEVEWQVLQYDSGAAGNPVAGGGANAQLAGQGENLQNGDEVVTRRYEYYQYTGPLDSETGEALAQTVATGTVLGTGTATDPLTGTVYNLSTMAVVGKFLGAQMSGFAPAAKLGLIDHLQDGEAGVPYVNRTVIVPGAVAFTGTTSGNVPPGMSLDPVSGVFSGTPTSNGLFTFSVTATDINSVMVSNTYTMVIAAAGGVLPAQSTITASASPDTQGSTGGSGSHFNGTNVTVTAAAALGYSFLNWTEGGVVVSTSSSYTFTAGGNRTLIANFGSGYTVSTSVSPLNSGVTTGDGGYASGASVSVTATPNVGYAFSNWSENGVVLSSSSNYVFTSSTNHSLVANFVALASPTLTGTSASVSVSGVASLVDLVNPNGVATFAYYQSGTTANYGSVTATQSLGNGTSAVVVTGSLSGIQPGSTYHFRLVTTSSAGTFYGADQTLVGPAPATFTLEASTKDPVTGIARAVYSGFGYPAINASSHVAFAATITGTSTNAGINSANNSGIWADDINGVRQLVVRTGTASVAPGTTRAVFSTLSDPVYNNNEVVAFRGALKTGVGDAVLTPYNTTTGIWSNDGGTLHLVARMGTQAPDCPAGARFGSVVQFALADQGGASNQGGVILLANLILSSGGVTAANAQGVWAVDTAGALHLVIRNGDIQNVNGVSRTVTGISFLASPASPAYAGGQTRSFDQTTGDMLFRLTYKDGSSSVIKVVFP